MSFLTKSSLSLLLLTSAVTSVVEARDYAWIIGGGYDLQSSQAQIEKNVSWAADVIRSRSPATQLKIYFDDGNDPLKDVLEWHPVNDSDDRMLPLARIYDTYIASGEQYRNHTINNVAGSTDTESMLPQLVKDFAELQQGDQALLIYNGHGGQQTPDPLTNVMWLWNDSSLDVRGMDKLLSNIDPAVPLRFVFTQCYSGGFAYLTHKQTNRCGFMAVPPDRQAEGCSAAVDIGDYRDYSTYFFAALSGRSRTGKPLQRDPDLDHDGQVSLYEAHLYALRTAVSSDLPRSTSETFLLDWRPWYQRLFATDSPDNQYARISKTLKQRYAIHNRTDIAKRRRALQQRLDEYRNARAHLVRLIKQRSRKLRAELERRWPEVSYAYTRNFVHFLQHDLDAAVAYLLANSDYTDLVSKQKEYQLLKKQRLAVERELMQLQKIDFLDTLASTYDYFQQHANEADRQQYQRLFACENSNL